MTISFERVASPDVPWDELDMAPGRTIFQTRAWLDFLVESQGAEPVVARILEDGAPHGWFTGAIDSRWGVPLLGSPLRGWTTSYMGFTALSDQSSDASLLLPALAEFAFKTLGCLHLEIMERSLNASTPPPPGFSCSPFHGFEVKLVDDAGLQAEMNQTARRNIRLAERNGVTVEVVSGSDPDFAREFHGQLAESFAKQNLVPTYPAERVESLIRHLSPTGRLLLLRARSSDGTPIASGVFPGLPGAAAYFWGGASRRDHQHLRPNEAIMWQALRWWRDQGGRTMDLGGGGEYKAKYGGRRIDVAWLRASRVPLIEPVRQGIVTLLRNPAVRRRVHRN